ncbi:hypothetical protein BCF74_13326 [Knoellia remsis]|uniref:Uncharacterized protein n=1 Tax=Knoellia remsis TaxID=407159 RepID=A0A2T0U3K7_9MICO|nr:DUF6584 family protein [Knoellia remsis]PRY52497.1 hypothetical protein BCF74_13326 [Knoellia remsis]
MSDALSRARNDLAAGRAWKARDRLHGALAQRQDDELLDLLAEVHYGLGDLPAAGALWFVTGRTGTAADAAIAAWRERYGGPQAQWFSFPPTVRESREWSHHLRELEGAARDYEQAVVQRRRQELGNTEAWWEPIVFGGGCFLVLASALALIVIGLWTVWHWIWG